MHLGFRRVLNLRPPLQLRDTQLTELNVWLILTHANTANEPFNSWTDIWTRQKFIFGIMTSTVYLNSNGSRKNKQTVINKTLTFLWLILRTSSKIAGIFVHTWIVDLVNIDIHVCMSWTMFIQSVIYLYERLTEPIQYVGVNYHLNI